MCWLYFVLYLPQCLGTAFRVSTFFLLFTCVFLELVRFLRGCSSPSHFFVGFLHSFSNSRQRSHVVRVLSSVQTGPRSWGGLKFNQGWAPPKDNNTIVYWWENHHTAYCFSARNSDQDRSRPENRDCESVFVLDCLVLVQCHHLIPNVRAKIRTACTETCFISRRSNFSYLCSGRETMEFAIASLDEVLLQISGLDKILCLWEILNARLG